MLVAMQIFREVEFVCLGAEQLQQLYRQSKNAVVREFTFSQKSLLPDIEGVSEAYIGFVPLSEFMKIIQDDSGEILGSIFLENVRDWQEYRAPVNDEIRETVSSKHTDRFVVMRKPDREIEAARSAGLDRCLDDMFKLMKKISRFT